MECSGQVNIALSRQKDIFTKVVSNTHTTYTITIKIGKIRKKIRMYKNTNKVKLRYLYLKIKKKNKITKTLHILIHNIIQIYMVTMYLKGILNELSYFRQMVFVG